MREAVLEVTLFDMKNILQISTYDIAGGAEKVAWNLFEAYRERGLNSWLAVGTKRSSDPNVMLIPRRNVAFLSRLEARLAIFDAKIKGMWRLRKALRTWAEPRRELNRLRGYEDFDFPGTYDLLDLMSVQPDIVHMHNLHVNYFDLRALPWFSHRVPVVLTLHDAWMLSGHCAHSFECERWLTGCGHCPDLTIYPSIQRDATAHNWRRKQSIYSNSRLYVTTPSKWLLQKVERSILAQSIIENQVGDKTAARLELGLPIDSHILTFATNTNKKNPWRDHEMMRQSVLQVAYKLQTRNIVFVALGQDGPPEHIGTVEIWPIPFQSDPAIVARYCQAADLYLHAAKADTFPTVVLEALACGVPVIATPTGGIPEQVNTLGTTDDPTGVLVKDVEQMADAIFALLTDVALRRTLSENAHRDAKRRFSLEDHVTRYLDWYSHILDQQFKIQM